MDKNLPESMTPDRDGHSQRAPGIADPEGQELTVGEVASLVGVSVRTLHHWDSMGIASPAGRTAAGYRSYSGDDVARIHRILVYQELGFSLATIRGILDDPQFDEVGHLRKQIRLLRERIVKFERMAAAVERLLASRASGAALTAREQAEIFGDGWRQDWAEEAKGRWGHSDEWGQFERNAAGLSEEERQALRTAGEAVFRELAQACREGVEPGSDRANELAERHRAMIGRMFDCTRSMHVIIGHLYLGDERFQEYLDGWERGLTGWLVRTIDANALAHGIDPDAARWE
ncbi:MerR family transcriptional regulator [Actinomycetaceae bacterium L2_0104]